MLDGQKIESAELVPYQGTETYDILPASEGGTYFAAGVRIGSTLNDLELQLERSRDSQRAS